MVAVARLVVGIGLGAMVGASVLSGAGAWVGGADVSGAVVGVKVGSCVGAGAPGLQVQNLSSSHGQVPVGKLPDSCQFSLLPLVHLGDVVHF